MGREGIFYPVVVGLLRVCIWDLGLAVNNLIALLFILSGLNTIVLLVVLVKLDVMHSELYTKITGAKL